jgi:3-methylfumaryl-CoA hydratase
VRKDAHTGPLAIITLRHESSQDGRVCVVEGQLLIYRVEANLNAPKPKPLEAPVDEKIKQTCIFSTTDLLRYFALTVNGRRIHYDRDYAINVEVYFGLIVHGPLLAENLLNFAQSQLGQLKAFQSCATALLFDFEKVAFCAKPDAKGATLWARGPDGCMCLNASAT